MMPNLGFRGPALTVKEVIEQLSKLDPDKPVWADGCDCVNPTAAVTDSDEMVVIEVRT